jgi:hypothetical protein
MSLRDDMKVFRQPGFYVSCALATLLIVGFLLLGGVVNQVHI